MSVNFGDWDSSIHDDFEQVKRIESGRKLAKDIVEINTEEEWAKIQGSAEEPYTVTLNQCNCADFSIRQGLPCKHIYCLAFALGKMEGLPVYDKKHKSNFNPEAEIERYKDLYLKAEISADTYVKICTAISKGK